MEDVSTPNVPPLRDVNPLDTVYATRRAGLRLLVDQHGTGVLGQKLGYTNGSYISQLLVEERTFTEVTARSFEQKLGLAYGWLDMQRAG